MSPEKRFVGQNKRTGGVRTQEQRTGVLAVTEDSRVPAPRQTVTAEISAAVDALLDDSPSEKPITVELVEEKSGVLSAAGDGTVIDDTTSDPPVEPISAAAAKALAAETGFLPTLASFSASSSAVSAAGVAAA